MSNESKTLEARLRGEFAALLRTNENDALVASVMTVVEPYLQRARREGFVRGVWWQWEYGSRSFGATHSGESAKAARELYPIYRTERVPRVVMVHQCRNRGQEYRVVDGVLEGRSNGSEWRPFIFTADEVRAVYDLLENPTEEVRVPVEED